MAYDDDDNNDSDLVKDLRKQLKEAKDEAKNLRAENETLVSYKTKVTVDDVIEAKGLNPKIKALIPKDVEDVSVWLEEFGELFGAPTSESVTGDEDPGVAEEVEGLDAQGTTENQGAEDSGLLAKINATANLKELEELVKGSA